MTAKKKTDYFDYFKERIEYFRDRFGLVDWDIVVSSSNDLGGDPAGCNVNYEGRLAEILFAENYNFKNKEEVSSYAAHEIEHVIHDPIRAMAFSRFITQKTIDDEIERLVVLHENIIKRYENELRRESS